MHYAPIAALDAARQALASCLMGTRNLHLLEVLLPLDHVELGQAVVEVHIDLMSRIYQRLVGGKVLVHSAVRIDDWLRKVVQCMTVQFAALLLLAFALWCH